MTTSIVVGLVLGLLGWLTSGKRSYTATSVVGLNDLDRRNLATGRAGETINATDLPAL